MLLTEHVNAKLTGDMAACLMKRQCTDASMWALRQLDDSMLSMQCTSQGLTLLDGSLVGGGAVGAGVGAQLGGLHKDAVAARSAAATVASAAVVVVIVIVAIAIVIVVVVIVVC